ncbi:MAG: UDP-N-acetylmuramate dehydrogenase [Candidatus Andersenbacteria bacterium]|nr:UDP-N-acetylmuramate dehydrogenase [Candidatus Andersenbacteria bacterium]
MSLRIQENTPLARLTSLHVGGPARYVITVDSKESALKAIGFAREHNLPFKVLGKGSNTLFPDRGYAGVILLMSNRAITFEGNSIRAGAGVFMRMLVTKALENNRRGLEELAGIPGTVGGAVRGNAGTWSTEVKDVLAETTTLQPNEAGEYEEVIMSADACGFGYRHSIFKAHPDWVILDAVLKTTFGDKGEGEVLVGQDLTLRHQKQPYDAPSAGSIFKNPDKKAGIFSGKLIEKAGLRGLAVGGAQVSEKHGNFIVNRGGASADDVMMLIGKIQTEVRAKFGFELEPEIEIID